ncbi:MAG: desulfoferrodoxin family protein [Lachnospiraceae bacterium]
MNSQKFFICEHCKNLVGMINNANVPLICCGEKMKELVPNTVEAAHEKHIPAVTISGDTVTVAIGSVAHPMTEEHHIEFIYVETKNGGQRKSLKVGEAAVATFKLVDDTALEVFAYCNLHGLWKVKVGE